MERKKQKVNCGDDWDVITATPDGGVIWRRYRDRKIVVTKPGEFPQDVAAKYDRSAATEPIRPTFAPGDYVKVEFPDEARGIGEWMWIRVTRCDDERKLVFGTLDSEPVNDYGGRIALGAELVVSFSQIRQHRKPTEFTKQ